MHSELVSYRDHGDLVLDGGICIRFLLQNDGWPAHPRLWPFESSDYVYRCRLQFFRRSIRLIARFLVRSVDAIFTLLTSITVAIAFILIGA